jgi:subtilisin family serine protease/uncharacterized protein (DUF2141 family)
MKPLSSRPRRRHAGRPAPRALPRLESLEERTLPSSTPLALDPNSYNPSDILVCFRPGSAAPSGQDVLPGTRVGPEMVLVPGLHRVGLDPGVSVPDALAAYRNNPNVAYAEPDYNISLQLLPNDPQFPSLWGLNNTGQTGGTPDVDINAPLAWEATTGSTKTVVAVIDTGVDYTHPDLYQNIWINQAEIPAAVRARLTDVDGDGLITFRDLNDPRNQGSGKVTDLNHNGYIDAGDILQPVSAGGWADGASQDGDTSHVDDLVGWNFVAGTDNPMDDHDHGTHVSGTIGAMGNNGVGVVGVDWNVQIMALKFLDATGNGSTSDAIAAINFAVAHGASLSNNSWAFNGASSQALYDAVNNARSHGHIFVAAAGNGNFLGIGQNNDTTPTWPSSINLDNVVAVAAIDDNGNLATFSNYGAKSVDLGAPGVDILSTTRNNTYSVFSGTSMATPHVTGVLALVRSLHPDWTYSQVIAQVLNNVDPDPALQGKTVTGGRLDAARAILPPPTVDLNWAGGGVSGPASVAANTPFTINRTYAISGGAADHDFTITYYASKDTTLGNADDVLLGSEVISAAGDKTVGTHAGVSPAFQFSRGGLYSLFARLDTADAIWETNESNNQVQSAGQVAVDGLQIIDNGDVGYSTAGAWALWANGGYQGDVQEATAKTGADVASWTFSGLTPGQYRVSVTWTAYPNRATNAPYTLLDGSTNLGTVAVNQQLAPAGFTDSGGTWQDLGSFQVRGNSLVVRLSDSANGSVIADAVRLERTASLPQGPAVEVLDGTADVPAGTGSVSLGSTFVGTALTKTFTVKNLGTQGVTLTGPIGVPAGFSVASGFGATTLAPGASTSFALRLDAAAPGSYSGQVSFGTNDPNNNPFTFSVSGTVSAVSILDDGDPGFSTTGSWGLWTGGGYQNDVHEATGRAGADVASWTFGNLVAGQYRVSVTWTAWSNRATNAPYTVLDGATSLGTVAVNQQSAPAGFSDAGVGWQDLGSFQVRGNSLVVQLADSGNGNVIADAVRIQWVAPLPQGPQAHVLDGTADVPAGTGSVSFGSTFVGTALTRTFTVKNYGTQSLTLTGPIGVPAGFSVASGFGATTLAPGASTSFALRLDAATPGSYSGQVSFGTNDPSNPFTFGVSGAVSAVSILDNGGPGYSTVGSWSTWGGSGYQGNVQEATGRAGSDVASWTFGNLLPGQYRVAVTWTAYSDRATNAPYTLLDGGTALATVPVNQQASPASFSDAGVSWADLGVYQVRGGRLVVQLSDSANGNVIADAVRLEWVSPLPQGPAVQVLDGSTNVPDNTGSVSLGSTFVGTGLTRTFTVKNLGTQDVVLSGPISVPAGFSVVSGFGTTTVAPGASTSFTLRLDGSAVGSFSGAVSFGTNDPANNPFTFSVSGTVSAVKVLDNSGPGYSTTGSWSTWAGGGYQGNVQEATGRAGADVASWTFANLLPGRYRVSVTWTAWSDRATNAPYTVLDGATALASVAVNQQASPAGFSDSGVMWQDLGTFAVQGNTLVVRLSDAGNGNVIADAVRVERVGDLIQSASLAGAGTGTAQAPQPPLQPRALPAGLQEVADRLLHLLEQHRGARTSLDSIQGVLDRLGTLGQEGPLSVPLVSSPARLAHRAGELTHRADTLGWDPTSDLAGVDDWLGLPGGTSR